MSIAPTSNLQYPLFQVLWSSKTCEDLRPPLQIRAFTSHSYRKLKEREGKRERRPHGMNTVRHGPQTRTDGTEGSAGKRIELSHTGFEPDDDVIESGAEWLQPHLEGQSAQPRDARDLEVRGSPRRHEGETQSVGTSSRVAAMSLISPFHPLEATFPGHPEEAEETCDKILPPDRGCNLISQHRRDDAIRNGYGGFRRSFEDEPASNKYPAEPKSYASPQTGGRSSDFEPSECQIDGNRPLHGATLHQPPENACQASTKSGSIELISADPSWIDAGQESSRSGQQTKSTSQTTWTEDADQRLLHLRDVAQLDWRTLISYFPSGTPQGIRERHQQLKKRAAADQAPHNHRPCQSQRRGASQVLPDPQCRTAGASVAKTRSAKAATGTKRKASASRCLARCRRPDVQVVPAVPSVPSIRQDTQPRVSRCGRTIRHPFRHRPHEGYL